MEDKMSRLNRSLMLKSIAMNLEHLRVTENSEPKFGAQSQGNQSTRRSSILTEQHQQLLQQQEEREQRDRETPSSATPPSSPSLPDRPPRISSPACTRKAMGSPRLLHKPSLLKNQFKIQSQASPHLPQQLSLMVHNPTSHKQADPKRLAQDLYNLGFRQDIATVAAQQHVGMDTAEGIARMLIAQKTKTTNTSDLMTRYGSLDNIADIDQDDGVSASPAGMRSASPVSYRSPSPSHPYSPHPTEDVYSPYSANKNYVMVPGFIQGRPNQISYIKYPQPVRRQLDPQHLPPRTGPVMACHLPCYPDPCSDSDELREATPPPQYSSNPTLYQEAYRANQYYNNIPDTAYYHDMYDNQLPPYPPGPGPSNIHPTNLQSVPINMPSAAQSIPTNQGSPSPVQSIPSTSQSIPTTPVPSTSYQHIQNISLNCPSASTQNVAPNHQTIPAYPASPIGEENPTSSSNQPCSVSVQDRIKKLNQNIASQNNSYKAAVSPTTPTPEPAPPKPEKPAKTKKSDSKTFKMFSPLPRRKAKPQPTPPKTEEEVGDKKPNVNSEAVKFILEQRIENLIKETANKKKRRDDFEASIVNCSEAEQANLRRIFAQKESDFLRLKRSKINKDMFTKIKTIGIGSFGEVHLVQKVDTGTLYAMKTLRKAEVWKRNQTAHVKAERDILSEADNEWVVKLHFSFQDKGNLYFVMDYVPGGDMMSLLIKMRKFPEWAATFYIAELVCAVESVHNLGFIHRDIKPDNILIDENGHLKLTDFGLCTGFHWTHDSSRYKAVGQPGHDRGASIDVDESMIRRMQHNCQCGDRANHQKPLDRRRAHQRCLAHSLVGTPNYIAPEVLLREWYQNECDWWSVGVILYEMIIGKPPFFANTPADTQMAIINWRCCLSIPVNANITNNSISLIFELLQDSDTRLGKSGANEIKRHPFFDEIDWDNLHNTRAPMVPELHFPTDTRYFDSFDEDRVRFSDTEDSQDADTPNHPFYEFTFRRFFGGDVTKSSGETSKQPENKGPVLV